MNGKKAKKLRKKIYTQGIKERGYLLADPTNRKKSNNLMIITDEKRREYQKLKNKT